MRLRSAALATIACLSIFATTASSPAHATTRLALPPVVLIVMENKTYHDIVGSSAAPYLNHTFIPAGTLFTNYSALFHPSLPNYLAMTSGTTSGCHTDSCPTRTFTTNNIFHQLSSASLGWTSWAESMPDNCWRSNSGRYAVRHNPAVYYADLFPGLCRHKDVPYPSTLPATLKPFTFITPNLCHDMHDCSVATGDQWLSNAVPHLIARGAIVVITFDEGNGTANRVMTAMVGPGVVPGTRNAVSYNHYGLLAGLETYFGVRRLNHASTATRLPI